MPLLLETLKLGVD